MISTRFHVRSQRINTPPAPSAVDRVGAGCLRAARGSNPTLSAIPFGIFPSILARTDRSLSPDGTRVAVAFADQVADQEGHDIWVWDLARQTFSRLTFDAGSDFLPAWRADGRRLIFSSFRVRPAALFSQAADGTGAA